MVLSFENKIYENLTQKVKFSLFKYSYISNKYLFFYKITYIILSLFEIFILIFFLSVNYSDLKNVQIIIALLKKYNIKHLVISAGTRHTPFVFSVEQDPFFTC